MQQLCSKKQCSATFSVKKSELTVKGGRITKASLWLYNFQVLQSITFYILTNTQN